MKETKKEEEAMLVLFRFGNLFFFCRCSITFVDGDVDVDDNDDDDYGRNITKQQAQQLKTYNSFYLLFFFSILDSKLNSKKFKLNFFFKFFINKLQTFIDGSTCIKKIHSFNKKKKIVNIFE